MNFGSLQLAGDSHADGRHNARNVVPYSESWMRMLRSLRSTVDFYQRQRRFADDDAVSSIILLNEYEFFLNVFFCKGFET